MKPLVALVHMPKAGGTTLTDVMRSVYGERLLIAHPLRGWPQQWPAEFLAEVSAHKDFYQAFSGHAAYGIHEVFGRETVYLSSVRDPLERFESYYNFVQHWKTHRYYQVAHGMSIGEFFRFLRAQDDIELFNLQCLMLCGQKDFQLAKEWVHSRYLAIAPLTYFSESIALIARALEWGNVTVSRLNQTPHKSTVADLSAADFKALADGNAADRDLVRYCEDLVR